jgi:phosphoserine aminotransferase
MSTAHRIFNFSAGPAVLPAEVLAEAQRTLPELPGVGMSILEISHRSKPFDEIIQGAEADIRKLAGVPDNYHVLFLQGGASLQFSMVPMNLLAAGQTADYIVTGVWSEKAVKEAQRVGNVNIAATTASANFSSIPAAADLRLTPGAAYVHLTSNNTIFGTQWKAMPDVGGAPLVNDASSDIFSAPLDVSKFALIYAGAQKNLGPSGVTLVIVRDDMVQRSPSSLHTMLSYRVHADSKSLYNTPPVFGIYIMRLVLQWLLRNGGLAAMQLRNERKAAKLYAELDRTGFYRGHARQDCRSLMNVTFRLPSEELEAKFAKESTAAGFDGLKGHRSVGGLRASIYNAFPEEGVNALIDFLRDFEAKNG